MQEVAAVHSMRGRVLEGRFRLDEPLGEGGLGVVWRGFHLRLAKPVAIKLMHQENLVREGLRARFEREARSLAALGHPNIVDVIDFGVDGELPYLVMELLEGRSLDRAIRQGLDPERALAIGRDVLRALAHAHALGIVHRDLKPANVFLQKLSDGSEVVRVLDFGLAKFVGPRESEPQLTRQGMVLGTPAYMAPEQAMGTPADARADVYAFAIVLFEMLTGRRPFEGEGGELVRQHLLVAPPTIASMCPEAIVSPELDRVIARAAAKSPAERYPSARELMEAMVALPSPAFRPREGATMSAARSRSEEAPTSVPREDLDRTSAEGGALAALPLPRGAPRETPPSDATFREGSPRIDRAAIGPDASAREAAGVPPIASAAAIPSTHQSRSPLPGTRRWALLIGIAASAVLLLAIAIAAIAAWSLGTVGGLGSTSAAPPVPPPIVGGSTVEEEEAPAAYPPDPDPWAEEEVPEMLASWRARLASGRELTSAQLSALRRYRGNHPRDLRARLLIAHASEAAGHRTDAVDVYRGVLLDDEAHVRGDPLSLPALVRMVDYDHPTSDAAAHLIWNYWGPRARAEVERALDREDDPALRERLERLLSSLAPGARAP